MNRRRLLGALGLSLATGLAGCTFSLNAGSPTPERQAVEVTFENGSDRRLVFTTAALPSGFGGVRIVYRDGTDSTLTGVERLADVPSEAWAGAVTFAPLADDADRRRYDITGGFGVGTTFDELPSGTTVVTTVSDPGRSDSIQSATASTCGDADRESVRVVVDAAGAVSAHTSCVDETTA